MREPPKRVLDLFCGASGAAMGLHQAWPEAEIVGVDIKPQKRYPFKFVQADVMTFPLEGYDFIWASPPCQCYSRLRHLPWLKDRKFRWDNFMWTFTWSPPISSPEV